MTPPIVKIPKDSSGPPGLCWAQWSGTKFIPGVSALDPMEHCTKPLAHPGPHTWEIVKHAYA